MHNSLRYAFVIGILFGITLQIKVYTGIAAVTTVSFYAIYLSIKKRFVNIFSALFLVTITAVVSAATFLPNNFGAASLLYHPFLFYSHYMQQPLFLSFHWELKRQEFLAHHNIKRIILLYLQAI